MKTHFFLGLLIILCTVNTGNILAQSKMTDAEIIKNLNPYAGSFTKYDYIFSDKTAEYFLMGFDNSDSNRSTVFIFVIHDIGEEEDFMKLDLVNDLAYQVKGSYIQKLEEGFIPSLLKMCPKVDLIRMKHFVKDKKLEKISSVPNHTNSKVYGAPLNVDLYLTYQFGEPIWTNYSHGSRISYNSRNFSEAKKKLEQAIKKGGMEPIADFNEKWELAEQAIKKDSRIALKDFFIKNNYSYKDEEFWEQFGYESDMLSYIYNGDFRYQSHNFYSSFLLVTYVTFLSNGCNELLPVNKKKITFNIETYRKNYSHTTYNGGWSFTNHYETVKEIKVVVIYLAPRFEGPYNESSTRFNKGYTKVVLSMNLERLKTITEGVRNLQNFIDKIGCDENMLSLLGENLYRLSQGQPSLQMEAGLFMEF